MKVTLKKSVMKVTLKKSAHQISASGTDSGDISADGTDFQRIYFPQCYLMSHFFAHIAHLFHRQ